MVPPDASVAIGEAEMTHVSHLKHEGPARHLRRRLHPVRAPARSGVERAFASGEFEKVAERPGVALLKRKSKAGIPIPPAPGTCRPRTRPRRMRHRSGCPERRPGPAPTADRSDSRMPAARPPRPPSSLSRPCAAAAATGAERVSERVDEPRTSASASSNASGVGGGQPRRGTGRIGARDRAGSAGALTSSAIR